MCTRISCLATVGLAILGACAAGSLRAMPSGGESPGDPLGPDSPPPRRGGVLEATNGAEGIPVLAGTTWIWYPEGEPASAAPVGTRYFRRRFELAKKTEVQSARLLVAADNEFLAYVNGKLVGRGDRFNSVAEFEVAALLVPGLNVVAIAVKNVGEAPNPAGLIARLEAVTTSGERAEFATDETWRTSKVVVVGWEKASYNSGGWLPAKVLGPAGMAPWGEIRGP